MSVRARVVLFALLSLLVTGFIFSNSLRSRSDSKAQSDVLADAVESAVFQDGEVGEELEKRISLLVRKAAHFVEFAGLGLCLGGLAAALERLRGYPVWGWMLFASLLVGVLDELIQSFTGRHSAVGDVLLDFSGALFGLLAVWMLARLRRKKEG